MADTIRPAIPDADEVVETTDRTAVTNETGVNLTRTWSVRMPSKDDGPVSAILQKEIPRRGTVHPQEPFAFAIEIGAQPDEEDEFTFVVTVRYTSARASGLSPEENPLLRTVEISVTDTTTQEDVAEDLDGRAVVNSSSEPLFGAVRDVTNHVLTITRNEVVFPWGLLRTYRNTVNANEFYHSPPNTWRLLSITGDLAFDSGIFFARVSYRFEHDPDGWNRRLMDLGTRGIAPGSEPGQGPSQRWVSFTDKSGRQFQGFTLMDGMGQALPDTAAPVFLPLTGGPWKFYRVVDFGVLNLWR